MRTVLKTSLLLVLLSLLSGCGFPEMGATEYGIKFRKLPPFLGGGVTNIIYGPAERAILWPWDSVYRFDTSVRDISWGPGSGGNRSDASFVYTRAYDGNEVGLAVTVRYQIDTDSEKLIRMVKEVATSNEEVEQVVVAVARADIRTYMNELRTKDFVQSKPRYEAVRKVESSMKERLAPYGINVIDVILDDFEFERLLANGTVDSSYQERLTKIQLLIQETGRERERIETVRAKKEQEFNDTQAKVNRLVEEAQGFKQQAKVRGDAYLAEKENQAKAVLAKGKALAEGMIEKINALSGPGGTAILKLELAKALLASDPRFVLMGESKTGDGLSVKRYDANDLLDQIGVLEGLQGKSRATGKSSRVENKK